MKDRKSLIGDVHLLLIKSSKILLLERKNTGYLDGYYHLPAGHKEQSESFVEALVRETYEEIGIKLASTDINCVHVMYRHSDKNNERIGVFFEAKQFTQEPKNMEPEKCNQIQWFDLDNLPNNIVPYALQAVNCYKNKVFYSEYLSST